MIQSLIGSFLGQRTFCGRLDMAACMSSVKGFDVNPMSLVKGRDYKEIAPSPVPAYKKNFIYISGYVDMSDKCRDTLVTLQAKGLVYDFVPYRYDLANSVGFEGFYLSPTVPHWYHRGSPAFAGEFGLK